jgi:hypothetical protein
MLYNCLENGSDSLAAPLLLLCEICKNEVLMYGRLSIREQLFVFFKQEEMQAHGVPESLVEEIAARVCCVRSFHALSLRNTREVVNLRWPGWEPHYLLGICAHTDIHGDNFFIFLCRIRLKSLRDGDADRQASATL